MKSSSSWLNSYVWLRRTSSAWNNRQYKQLPQVLLVAAAFLLLAAPLGWGSY
jgi:hypothetical protein